MKNKDTFLYFIYLSIGLHVAILGALTIKMTFFPSEALEYQRSVRVDVVALPEKTKEKPKVAQKKPEPVKEKKPEPKPKPKPVAKKPKKKPKPKKKKISLEKKKKEKKKVKDEQQNALDRLKAMQDLKKRKKKKEEPKPEFKGNQISKGFSPDGGLPKLHHQAYLEELDSHIRSFWSLPEWLNNDQLSARVLLMINRSGGIVGKSFILKSGNDLFDQHVFATLDKASPFPAPPTSLVNSYETQGIEIRFPE